MLDTKARQDLAPHWRQVIVAIAITALAGACAGGSEASLVRIAAADSGLAHALGARPHEAPPQASPAASAVASSGPASNGGFSRAAANGHLSAAGYSARGRIHGTVRAVDASSAASLSPAPARSSAGSAAVAPTPDELSALAASLVVPVAGVTPAELRGSFDAPRDGGARRHNALDIPAPRGTPVIAATPGRVLRLFNSKAGGLMIYTTDATERFILMYGHLDRYAEGLTDGMPLSRGQTIGYVGTTGNAPPDVPHLHFAIARTTNVRRWWSGTPVDPAPLFKR